jgi:predicted pyridoxine 5'-phosphate oxidase superfamily flavin-nucleotide-binding protein
MGRARSGGMRLTEEMKRTVVEQRLCFAATVCADGSPNLSPKGTVWVYSETELAFFDLASPQTVQNLRRDPRIELNVVDQRLRKGFRFRGTACVTSASDEVLDALDRFPRRVPAAHRIRSLVVIDVTDAWPLVSPVYQLIDDVARIAGEWEAYWLGLWRDQDDVLAGEAMRRRNPPS